MFVNSFRNGSGAYRRIAIETGVTGASPYELILMLFDGALVSIGIARANLAIEQRAIKCEAVAKAIAIIDLGLKASLDYRRGGDLAQRLGTLYDYIVRRMVEANAHDDPQAFDEVTQLLTGLRDAWTQIRQTEKAVS
ncbi:MAG TPA: flagellar export chaperone FliS [Burkholderiales bacterium]|nr:flagellar export chaperone FliS [Burkholderiales bacterium]